MGHPAATIAILLGEWQGLLLIRHIRNGCGKPMPDGSRLI
jgi:hypothetical protein